MKRLLGILALGVLAGHPLSAQEIVPGTRLRVMLNRAPWTSVVGTLDRPVTDTLRLRAEDSSVSAIPLMMIGRVEVSRGRHSSAGTGALIGLGAGGLAGAVLLVEWAKGMCGFMGGECSGHEDYTGAALLGGIGGGLIGAGLGALVGMEFHSEKWQVMPMTTLQMMPVSLGRVGLGIALRF